MKVRPVDRTPCKTGCVLSPADLRAVPKDTLAHDLFNWMNQSMLVVNTFLIKLSKQ